MQKITDVFNWEEFNIAALEKKHDITAKAKEMVETFHQQKLRLLLGLRMR